MKKIARQHSNGAKSLQASTAVVVDEAIEVTGPVGPASGVPFGHRCDLTDDCARLVTHQVPVRVDGRDGVVYGCDTHLPQSVVAMGDADGA